MSNEISKCRLHAEDDRWSESTWELPLRAGVYAMTSLFVVSTFVLLGETKFSAYLAPTLAVAAAFVVWRSNRARPYSRLITLFFWLAAGHALFGYWAAANSTGLIWIGSNADQMFRRSLFVIATTLLVAAFTYDIALRFPLRKVQNFCLRLQVSERKLILTARIFLLLGSLLVTYVIVAAGFVPILTSNPGMARYLSSELTTRYKEFEWVLYLGLDFLACSLPLVLFSGLNYRRNLDRLMGVVGILAVLSTLRRSYVISLVAVLLLTIAFVQRKFPRRYLTYLLLLGAAYFGSQLIFLDALGQSVDNQAAASATLSGLPEVRDLGWAMSLMGEKRLYGATFASLIPLLGRVSDFKTRNGLVEITTVVLPSKLDSQGLVF